MRCATIHSILLLVLYSLWPLSLCGGDVSSDNQQLVERVAKAFPQECRNQQYCILLTSIQRCVGCGIMAVNGTMELLHQIDSSVLCIVVLAAEDKREAEIVQKKFLTPFFLADTTFALLASDRVQKFPELFVVDRSGNVVYHRNDLQHADPEYLSLRQVLLSDTSSNRTTSQTPVFSPEQKTDERIANFIQAKASGTEVYLAEPDTHPISRLSTPVYSTEGNQLAAINTLTNSIDIWRTTDGKFISSVVLPDSIRYRFRTDSSDWRWRDMENQGSDIAKFRSLAFASDTLYTLVDILGGYTKQTVLGKTPLGTVDSMVHVVWQNRCIIVRVHNGSFLDVIELTEPSTLIQLCTMSGLYGGTSLQSDFDSHRPVAEQRDSMRRFTFYSGAVPVAVVNPLLVRAQQVIAEADDSAVLSIGKIAVAENRDLWYCAPENGLLLSIRFPDRLQRIEPQGALRQCGGSILLGEKMAVAEVYRKATYTLTGMTAFNTTMALLLESRDSSSSRIPYRVQYYSSTGAFQGEQQISALRTDLVSSAFLAGSDSRHLLVLARTNDKRWKLLQIPVPGIDTTPVSQGNSNR